MKRLKELRKKCGLTQVTLASMMGVSQSSLAGWEAGNSYPSAEKLPKLADILGVSIDQLYGRDGAGQTPA